MNKYIQFSVLSALLVSCTLVKQQITTIDKTLQRKVDSILQDKLIELDAVSGQVIVMEVQTGQIKAMVGLEKKDSTSAPYEYAAQPTKLVNTASVLAALETGKVKLSDKVDTGEGIYNVNGKELKDHNWHRGGYGEITIQEGLALSSNIAVYKALEKGFGSDEQAYLDMLKKYEVQENATPLQTLTFYNAIANNGIMVQPQLYKDSTIVINPQIASRANIDSMKVALRSVVTDGLGKYANSEKVQVAGKTGTIQVSENEDDTEGKRNTEFAAEFCGFFPVDNPKYSIIVTINKMGYPISGGLMAAPIFKEVVDCIVVE